MKRVNIALITLAILGTSFSYADCPPLNTIYVDRDNHYIAQGLGGIWRDPLPTAGYPISPEDFFDGASGEQVSENVTVVDNFVCIYNHKNGGPVFLLFAPSIEQKYVLGGKNWEPVETGWLCSSQQINDCQFSLPSEEQNN